MSSLLTDRRVFSLLLGGGGGGTLRSPLLELLPADADLRCCCTPGEFGPPPAAVVDEDDDERDDVDKGLWGRPVPVIDASLSESIECERLFNSDKNGSDDCDE